jgi:hypothetical protein
VWLTGPRATVIAATIVAVGATAVALIDKFF